MNLETQIDYILTKFTEKVVVLLNPKSELVVGQAAVKAIIPREIKLLINM